MTTITPEQAAFNLFVLTLSQAAQLTINLMNARDESVTRKAFASAWETATAAAEAKASADSKRLAWCLPLLTGGEDPNNNKAMALAGALIQGKDGIAVIDHAMQVCP